MTKEIKIEIIKNNKSLKKTIINTKLTSTLLEIIEKTYLQEVNINISNPINKTCNKELAQFLTYILAYPKNIKTPTVKVNDEYLNLLESKCSSFENMPIVCFSSGIDSTGALLNLLNLGKSPVALWCDYGQPYNNSEKKAALSICNKLNVPLVIATIDLAKYTGVVNSRFGHVFPARNLLIAFVAMAFNPSEIILAGLKDELIVPDKSLRMYSEFPSLFDVKLYSPFVNMTKAEVLSIWKKEWNIFLSAFETVSCYEKNENCQNCSSCAKREVALIASGYSDIYPNVFTNQKDLILNHWFSRVEQFVPERREDMLIALEKFKEDLSDELKVLTEEYCDKYRKDIDRRIVHINNITSKDLYNAK